MSKNKTDRQTKLKIAEIKKRWVRKDLSRWNRSGLQSMSYADGNAADYLETMRMHWQQQFPNLWIRQLEERVSLEEFNTDDQEQGEEWIAFFINDQLEQQYKAERSDLAWELARTFARSAHVLTKNIDDQANAAFLRTAKHWADIKRVVGILGYQPAGATSATTSLSLRVRGRGFVQKGLQIRYQPDDGSEEIIFETLQPVEVDERFNELEVQGKERSVAKLESAETTTDQQPYPWRTNAKTPVQIGESAIIQYEDGQRADAARIINLDAETIKLEHESENWKNWPLADVNLFSSPRLKRRPWINGDKVRRTSQPHGFSPGSIIAWRKKTDTDSENWHFAEVLEADTFGFTLKAHTTAYNKIYSADRDHKWLDYTDDTLEVRRAVKVLGSAIIPPIELSEAEKAVGILEEFRQTGLTDGSIAKIVEDDNNTSQIISFTIDGNKPTPIDSNNTDYASIEKFIKWLFNVRGFTTSFPVTPLELVKIGAMLMTKDARIPSTGQLVFEAFLDLFGEAGSDTYPNGLPHVNAMFRYWGEPDESDETEPANIGSQTTRPKFSEIKGELWYLPKAQIGEMKNLAQDTLGYFTAYNNHDNGWYFFDGLPSGLHVNQLAAVRFSHEPDRWRAAKILEIVSPVQFEDNPQQPHQRYQNSTSYGVHLDLPTDILTSLANEQNLPALLELQTDYRAFDKAHGWNLNNAPISGELIPLKPPCPGTTLKGRKFIASNSQGITLEVRVSEVLENCQIKIQPSLPDDQGFTIENLRLNGNIVQAGHGEYQPNLFRSAEFSKGGQSKITIEETEIATVPDSSLSRGAREDIEVRVAGELWQYRNTLKNSDASDPHYMLGLTDEGQLQLIFGDGTFGRRIPPGNENIEIQYRRGAGERANNLAPYSLKELLNPHPLVYEVVQPFATAGGADAETPELIKTNAPASLLAMDRASSLQDFENLARQHRSVVHAKAQYEIAGAGYRCLVSLTAAGPKGVVLNTNQCTELAQFLKHRAPSSVAVQVKPHRNLPVRVHIIARIDLARFNADSISETLINALLIQFSAERRQLAQPILIAEIYALTESIEGIDNTHCEFEPTRQESPAADTLAFIASRNDILISVEEYKS